MPFDLIAMKLARLHRERESDREGRRGMQRENVKRNSFDYYSLCSS